MDAAAYTAIGGPDDIELIELEDPEPDDGEAIVEMAVAGINYHDLRMLHGGSSWLEEGDLPYVSGADIAGTVVEVGAGVDHVSVGDEVVLYPGRSCGSCRFCLEGPETLCENREIFHGAFQEQVCVEATRLIHLPETVSFTQAAALPVAYTTAWHSIRLTEAAPGDLVLVPGATGGVGVATLQLLDVLGATSIGTTTAPEKVPMLGQIGADHALEVGSPTALVEAVSAIGEPDAAVNHLGGEYIQAGLSTLRRGGTMAICGRTTGDEATLVVKDHFRMQRSLVGSVVGTQPELERVVNFVACGMLDPVVDQKYPLDELATAYRRVEDRDHVGKVLVTAP